jgi:hypothetical protein
LSPEAAKLFWSFGQAPQFSAAPCAHGVFWTNYIDAAPDEDGVFASMFEHTCRLPRARPQPPPQPPPHLAPRRARASDERARGCWRAAGSTTRARPTPTSRGSSTAGVSRRARRARSRLGRSCWWITCLPQPPRPFPAPSTFALTTASSVRVVGSAQGRRRRLGPRHRDSCAVRVYLQKRDLESSGLHLG